LLFGTVAPLLLPQHSTSRPPTRGQIQKAPCWKPAELSASPPPHPASGEFSTTGARFKLRCFVATGRTSARQQFMGLPLPSPDFFCDDACPFMRSQLVERRPYKANVGGADEQSSHQAGIQFAAIARCREGDSNPQTLRRRILSPQFSLEPRSCDGRGLACDGDGHKGSRKPAGRGDSFAETAPDANELLHSS
jgi:hypothetical protein